MSKISTASSEDNPLTYSILRREISFVAGQHLFQSDDGCAPKRVANHIVKRLARHNPWLLYYCEVTINTEFEGTVIVTDPRKNQIFQYDFRILV